MMKLKSILFFSLGLAVVGSAPAQLDNRPENKALGVGVIIGEPTGLSLKKWIGEQQAIDAGIGWSFSENDSLHIHVDYLFHRFDLVQIPEMKGRLPLYAGLGGRVKLKEDNNGRGRNDNDTLVGIRVPLGMAYLFADAPLELFVEVVPILEVAPDSDFDLNAAVGARYYF